MRNVAEQNPGVELGESQRASLVPLSFGILITSLRTKGKGDAEVRTDLQVHQVRLGNQ